MKTIVFQPTKKQIDETASWPLWEKEESEFPWSYDQKETCYVLEGEAEVREENGEVAHFGAGDMVIFPKGLACTWKIMHAIKKRYYFGE